MVWRVEEVMINGERDDQWFDRNAIKEVFDKPPLIKGGCRPKDRGFKDRWYSQSKNHRSW